MLPHEHLFIGFWITLFGGAVGSFLNVVIWRLPEGMSLSEPPSHCPKCGHPIRFYDNVPVLAWLWLGGKCRDCKAPISMRYPLVEAATAAVFLGLYLLVAFGIPERLGVFDGQRALIAYTGEQRLGVAVFWIVLGATLLPASLIEFDRKPFQWKLFRPVLVMGVVLPVIADWLRPISLGVLEPPMMQSIAASVLAVGGAALLTFLAAPRSEWPAAAIPAIAVGLCLGPIVGGAAVLGAMLSYALLRMVARLRGAERFYLGPVTLVSLWTAAAVCLLPWLMNLL